MFLLTLSSDIVSHEMASRGANSYSQLYSHLLNLKLNQRVEQFGPLRLTLLSAENHQEPVLVSSGSKHACILGHPSCLSSAGTDVTGFVRSNMAKADGVDIFVRNLQGDFVAIYADDQSRRWEIAIDPIGLGKLYVLLKGNTLILSDMLYLLASCTPLELDMLGCYTLDLCGFLYGGKTIYKEVLPIEMGQKVQGEDASWKVGRVYHFIDEQGPDCGPKEVAEAYLDASEPRLTVFDRIRHCMTGGTDSRTVLAIMSALGVKPTIFCWRWDKDDTQLAHLLANELGLDFHSTVREYLMGPEQTRRGSWLAETLLLDGGLAGMFTSRNYLFDCGPRDLITKGSFSAGIVKSTWGVGYAGMAFPTKRKMIDRLLNISLMRRGYDASAFPSPQVFQQVRDYVERILLEQANEVEGVDKVKLCNYLHLRNREARWAAQILQAANHYARMDLPLAYAKGVSATWRVPSPVYRNIGLVRGMLAILEPRLTEHPFNDGSPAKADISAFDWATIQINRKLKKGRVHFKNRVFGTPSKKMLGNMRPPSLSHPAIPVWDWLPYDLLNDRERRTCDVYKPLQGQADRLHQLSRTGHLKNILTFEFASRVYDWESSYAPALSI